MQMPNVESSEVRKDIEELARIDVDEIDTPNTTAANEVEEEDPTKRRTKKRKSQVWNDFTMTENDDETRKAICNHCCMKFAMKVGGPTSTLTRHQKICVARQVNDKKQKILTLDSVICDGKVG